MNSDLIRQVSKSPSHQMLGLYIHIPFCSAICNYCNFNRGLFDADLKVRYVDALILEIREAGLRARTTGEMADRSEEHTSELQSLTNLVCRLLLEKKNKNQNKKQQA